MIQHPLVVTEIPTWDEIEEHDMRIRADRADELVRESSVQVELAQETRLYEVTRRCAVRAGIEADSARLGTLDVGDRVDGTQTAMDQQGKGRTQVRVRSQRGTNASEVFLRNGRGKPEDRRRVAPGVLRAPRMGRREPRLSGVQ